MAVGPSTAPQVAEKRVFQQPVNKHLAAKAVAPGILSRATFVRPCKTQRAKGFLDKTRFLFFASFASLRRIFLYLSSRARSRPGCVRTFSPGTALRPPASSS